MTFAQVKNPRVAFTLVEVLISSMILVTLFTAVFKIFRSSTYMMKAGMWTTKAQNSMRNTLTLLRDEIAKSTWFTTVTENGIIEKSGDYYFYYKKGELSTTFNGPIFKFYQCRTAIDLPGQTSPGSAVYCEVVKTGSKLFFTKTQKEGTSDETTFTQKLLLEDISKIKIDDIAAASTEQMAQKMISIVFSAADPEKPDRLVTEETKAKVDCKTRLL